MWLGMHIKQCCSGISVAVNRSTFGSVLMSWKVYFIHPFHYGWQIQRNSFKTDVYPKTEYFKYSYCVFIAFVAHLRHSFQEKLILIVPSILR